MQQRRSNWARALDGDTTGLSVGLVAGGLVAGLFLSEVAVVIFGALSHHINHPATYGSDVASLIGLWSGLLGSVAYGLRRFPGMQSGSITERLRLRLGFAIRWRSDVLLGVFVGIASQYVLVPVLELPLLPFVPHLFHRLGQPAMGLTNHVNGIGLVILGVLVCLGSPLVEELFFRGLVLRSLLARSQSGPQIWMSIFATGLLFGLLHFEALELLGLFGFGVVLAILATRTGRLGPGIVAHVAFNATTFISLARSH